MLEVKLKNILDLGPVSAYTGSMRIPVWAVEPPPDEWIENDVIPIQTWSRLWGQFVLYRLVTFGIVYWMILWGPKQVMPEWPYGWMPYVGIYLILGGLLGSDILNRIPYHHMVSLPEVVNIKIKALLTWPLWYLKLAFIFLFNAAF